MPQRKAALPDEEKGGGFAGYPNGSRGAPSRGKSWKA